MGAVPGLKPPSSGLEGAHGMLQRGLRVIGQVGYGGSTAEENKPPERFWVGFDWRSLVTTKN